MNKRGDFTFTNLAMIILIVIGVVLLLMFILPNWSTLSAQGVNIIDNVVVAGKDATQITKTIFKNLGLSTQLNIFDKALNKYSCSNDGDYSKNKEKLSKLKSLAPKIKTIKDELEKDEAQERVDKAIYDCELYSKELDDQLSWLISKSENRCEPDDEESMKYVETILKQINIESTLEKKTVDNAISKIKDSLCGGKTKYPDYVTDAISQLEAMKKDALDDSEESQKKLEDFTRRLNTAFQQLSSKTQQGKLNAYNVIKEIVDKKEKGEYGFVRGEIFEELLFLQGKLAYELKKGNCYTIQKLYGDIYSNPNRHIETFSMSVFKPFEVMVSTDTVESVLFSDDKQKGNTMGVIALWDVAKCFSKTTSFHYAGEIVDKAIHEIGVPMDHAFIGEMKKSFDDNCKTKKGPSCTSAGQGSYINYQGCVWDKDRCFSCLHAKLEDCVAYNSIDSGFAKSRLMDETTIRNAWDWDTGLRDGDWLACGRDPCNFMKGEGNCRRETNRDWSSPWKEETLCLQGY